MENSAVRSGDKSIGSARYGSRPPDGVLAAVPVAPVRERAESRLPRIEPLVSVIVISYNDAKRLARAVTSVLGQSLRALEVIVVDDASTDGTARVVEEIDDPRVRYVRRTVNSGGCGAPRNDGLAQVAAPYVMFLDSDDELPRHACKSMLTEIERTGADFVTGQVGRLFEESGRTRRYYPGLYRRRVLGGIREDPEMFLDCFSTNKLYRTAFLRRAGLWFREDLHYEDHLWSARLFCAARRIAVVPWVVYLWRRTAEDGTYRRSISRSLHELGNVADRVRAAVLCDRHLESAGFDDLVAARQRRFLRQDLRVYLNEAVPAATLEWVERFRGIVAPYLAGIRPEAYDGIDPIIRVCCHLIGDGTAQDLRVAARSLTGPRAAPRRAVRVDGRTYWGPVPAPGLDITACHMAELPFSASRLRHEVERLSADGGRLALTVRTYDPFGVLDGIEAVAHLSVRGLRKRLSPRRQADGSYLSTAEFDITDVPLPRFGFTGHCDPAIVVTRVDDGRRTRDVLLVPPGTGTIELRIPGHEVTVRPEGGAATLRVEWRCRSVRRHLPRLRRRLARRLGSGTVKVAAYRALIHLLPRRRDLVLFEADAGKGYTGNPRYLHEEILRRGLPLRAVWSTSKGRRGFPADVALVRRWSWRYVWTLARAAYWVDSHNLPLSFPKPRGTRYLQTWHGQGIKSIGFDAPDLRGDFDVPRRRWRAAVARWDALVAPSAEFERLFVPSNGYTGPVLRYGSPRCDVLVRGDAETARRVRAELEISEGRRVLLYAPTYRDHAKGTSVRADLRTLADALADEWVLILRTHPTEKCVVPQDVRYFVRPAGTYPEINDLMLASDALLTDYSSVMCDYAVTGKPMLFLIDDWEEYRRTGRGVYHDLPAIAPGPCARTTEEVVEALRDLDWLAEAYADRYAAFRRMWCADENGDAAARIVDAFFGQGR
ncbi:CDP-glycerol glycerophosphotransferase family protein [Thermopolyspora sp. NPDC052614]|uniref:bifunctional glycosyltransferase/CDP-glycerol:glycerophosphate glycerophosphotransferase n=1 Tax=Thermopolyspora sp. NPDC052614 TaxID=3155682 RepID=UPI003435E98E